MPEGTPTAIVPTFWVAHSAITSVRSASNYPDHSDAEATIRESILAKREVIEADGEADKNI